MTLLGCAAIICRSPGSAQRVGWLERSETHRNVSDVSAGYGFA